MPRIPTPTPDEARIMLSKVQAAHDCVASGCTASMCLLSLLRVVTPVDRNIVAAIYRRALTDALMKSETRKRTTS